MHAFPVFCVFQCLGRQIGFLVSETHVPNMLSCSPIVLKNICQIPSFILVVRKWQQKGKVTGHNASPKKPIINI